MSTDPAVLDRIVKAYDVRGTTPDEMNDDVAFALGVAFARFVESGTIIVARDMRVTGESLAAAFANGAMENGANIVDLGLASTDMVYFAAGVLNAPGAMFTASHNPAEYNGIKFCLSGARPIGKESGLLTIEKFVRDGVPVSMRPVGIENQRDMLNEYVDHLLTLVDVSNIRKLNIVIDAGNGMAGHTAPAVLRASLRKRQIWDLLSMAMLIAVFSLTNRVKSWNLRYSLRSLRKVNCVDPQGPPSSTA